MDSAKPTLKQKFSREMTRYCMYTAFFTLFFCAFSTYRRLILGEYAISYIHFGYSFVESLILAKVILIGEMFGLGERFSNKPLIIPTLYKTLVFTLFVLAFGIFEHFFMGFITGKNMTIVYQELIDKGIDEILMRMLVMFFVFILFFAFLEIGQVLGDNKLFNLFLRGKDKNAS